MSGSLLVLAPLRLEAAAVGGPDRHVLRVGMGRARARIAAGRITA